MDKFKLQAILLSILSIAGMVLGRLPRVGPALSLLSMLVMEHWDELWAILQGDTALKAKAKAMLAMKGERDDALEAAFSMVNEK